ncbi:amidase family protein [Enterovirga sp.]|uniref:amidase n=1 Tax=Enterovirga sp. TaxID=2026350 RepID=UPI00262B3C6A|nr:amidase family protein [Enterovirga sp.]MDB5592100.1 hypothetical protein [Enterovirga sp.]
MITRTALRLAAEHSEGERDPAATAREALALAERLQPRFNAFAEIDTAGATAAAEEIGRRVAAGEEAGPLAGVPVSVKDILDVAGLPTRWGSRLLAGAAPAKTDVAAVARLRRAGAVILGKTTTTEFAHSPLSTSPLTGTTRNPWALDLTPGGSSSGAGVAVATGITPVALATDAGCSTRLPAACTAVYGLKPTLGRIPHDRVPDAFGTFIHLGLLARNLADLGAALDAVAGPHPADPNSLRAPVGTGTAAAPGDLSGTRVLVWMRVGNRKVSEEVRASVERAAAALREAGAEVAEAAYDLAHPDPVWRVLQQANWASRFAATPAEDRAKLDGTLNAGIDEALGYSGLDLSRAQAKRTELFRAVQGRFGEHDLILTPCLSAPPVAAEYDLRAPLVIDGEEVGDLRAEWTPALSLFDLTGHPALAVPAGFAGNGGPLGVQLAAPWYDERSLFRAAEAMARALPVPVWREG